MKLSVVPQGLLERIVFRLGIVPVPLVLGFWGMGAGRLLIDGTRLGVFEALAGEPKSAEQVADLTRCDSEGVRTMLNALNGFGFVRRKRGRYRNARVTEKWLLGSSKQSCRESMLFFDYLWDAMGEIGDGVRTGKPIDFHHKDRPPEFWDHYMRSLGQFARYSGAEIARRVRLSSPPRRLLDVAGGHGEYSAAFCRRYPGLTAEVLDLPEASVCGRRIIEEARMSDRVVFRDADLRTEEWGGGYDVVLLFNILHNITVNEAKDALARAREALRPGGTLIVLDSEHEGGDGDLSTTSGFNELFFFVVSGARAYPEGTILSWMAEAGFSRLRRKRLLALPGAILLVGRGV